MKKLLLTLALILITSVTTMAGSVGPITVAASADDGYYRVGGAQFSITAATSIVGQSTTDYRGEIRFQLDIPDTCIIDSVEISWKCGTTSANTVTTTWYCEDTASASALSADSTAFKTRIKTTASASWSQAGVTQDSWYIVGGSRTALKAPLQEVVNRSDWSPNAYVGFMHQNNGSVQRHQYHSQNATGTANDPTITVWFTIPGGSSSLRAQATRRAN